MNPLDIAYEIFSELERNKENDDALWSIIYQWTGFPSFFDGDPETCFRQQLQAYKNRTGDDTDTQPDYPVNEED
jgi:hypothetical protein